MIVSMDFMGETGPQKLKLKNKLEEKSNGSKENHQEVTVKILMRKHECVQKEWKEGAKN